jgi:hypothetical protein
MIKKKYFRLNITKKLAFFTHTTASFCKDFLITLVFEKNNNIFAENSNHNMDPRVTRYGGCLLRAVFLKITEVVPIFGLLFSTVKVMHKFCQ